MNSDLYFEGKKYISARQASEVSGYSTDYIGQLCRGKNLESRMIGRNWFVSEMSLRDYQNSFSLGVSDDVSDSFVDSGVTPSISSKNIIGKDLTSSSRDTRDTLNLQSQFIYSSDDRPLIPNLKSVKNDTAKIISNCHSSRCENQMPPNSAIDSHSFLYTDERNTDSEHIKFQNRNFNRALRNGKTLFVLSAIVLGIFFIKDNLNIKDVYKKSAVLMEETSQNVVLGLTEAKNYLATVGAKNRFNIFGKLSNFKLFSEVDNKSSLKESAINFGNNLPEKISGEIKEIFSGMKNYFAGFFDRENKFADNEIIPIKNQSSSQGTSSSSSSLSINSPFYSAQISNEEDNEGGNNNFIIASDITRREVLDLIKQYDDNNKSLFYASNALTVANSTNANQTISDLKEKISLLENKNYLYTRQIDHPTNFIASSAQNITSLDGATIINSSFSGTTGTFTGLLTGVGGTFSGSLTVSGAGTSTFSGGINANRFNSSATSTLAGLVLSSQGLTISTLDCSASGQLLQTDSSGNVICGTDDTGSGGGTFAWTPTTNYGALANATGTPIWFQSGLQASSTSHFVYASTTALTVSGSAYFSSLGQGWLHTSGGTNAITSSTSPTVAYLTATSTTATSTFAGGLSVAGSSGLTVLQNGKVGIGITSPYADLHIYGDNQEFRMGASNVDGSNFSSIIELAEHANTDGTFRDGAKIGNVATDGQERLFMHVFSNNIDNGGIDILRANSNLGIGTTSPNWKLSVAGIGSFDDNVRTSYFTATSTTATSTFAWGLQANALNVTSQTASSTFANGIVLSKGCVLMPSGTCLGSGGAGTVTSIATNNGLTGGTITDSGTIGLNTVGFVTNGLLTWNGSNLTATGTPNLTAGYFTATTSIASTFPYASTTMVTATTASSTNLIVSGTATSTNLVVLGNSTLGTVISGVWNGTSIGNSYVDDDITLTNITQITNRAITDTTGTLTVARGGTGQTSFGQGWLHSDGTTFTSSTSPTVNYITATSTTATSTFNGDINLGTTSNILQGGQRFLTSSTTAAGNLTIGYQSATELDAKGGLYNTGVGYQALGNATSTNYNTALGYQALKGSATISNIGRNTAVGYQALTSNTTGYQNTAYGAYSLQVNTTGYSNTSIGYNSLSANTTGIYNMAIGAYSLLNNTTGNYNMAIGENSFRNNTTGAGNVGMGAETGYSGTTQDQNSVIDNYATFIGYQASRSEAVASTSALTNITAIGKNARVGASNSIVLGGTGADAVNVGIGTTSPYARLSVVGETVAEKFTATSTTATSTFNWGIKTTAIQTTSTTATSTFARGIDLAGGCFAINGVCIAGTGGSGTVTSVDMSVPSGLTISGNPITTSGTLALGVSMSPNTFVAVNGTGNGFIASTSPTVSYLISTTTTNSSFAGNLGLGTTSPFAKLSVSGDTALDSMFVNFASSSAPSLTLNYLKSATSTIPSNTNYAWSIATSTTASPIFSISTLGSGANINATTTINGGFNLNNGALVYDYSSNITTINSLEAGPMNFDNDAGILSWIDMEITSSSALNTKHSYTAQIDSNPILSVYGESDGVGTTKNLRVGIGTTTPLNKLTIHNATTTADADLGFTATSTGLTSFYNWTMGVDISDAGKFKIASSTSLGTNDRFVIDGEGKVGVGTTTPWRTFSVNGTVSFANITTAVGSGSLCLTSTNDVTYNASDACLSSLRSTKHNIENLTISGLEAVNDLEPVSFVYNEGYGDSRTRYGFIAEDVAMVNNHLATYNGALMSGIDDRAILSLTVKAIQELNLNLVSIASTSMKVTPESQLFVTNFFDNLFNRFRNWLADATNGIEKLFAKEVRTGKLCLDDVCVSKTELQALLQNASNNISSSSSLSTSSSSQSSSSSISSSSSSQTGQLQSSSSAESSASSESSFAQSSISSSVSSSIDSSSSISSSSSLSSSSSIHNLSSSSESSTSSENSLTSSDQSSSSNTESSSSSSLSETSQSSVSNENAN